MKFQHLLIPRVHLPGKGEAAEFLDCAQLEPHMSEDAYTYAWACKADVSSFRKQ